MALARSQDKIGWRHFTEGYISTHFYNIQNFHLAMNSRFLNGANWTKQFISRLLHILHSQWIFKNVSLHDTTCRYLHNKRLEDIILEIEWLSSITPKEVPQESRFLLKINFAHRHVTLELKAYWILAVKAALAAQNKELAQDRPKCIRNLVNTQIPNKKKLGITDVKQQIQANKRHRISTEKESMRYNPEDHHTMERYLSANTLTLPQPLRPSNPTSVIVNPTKTNQRCKLCQRLHT